MREIPLHYRQRVVAVTLVDDADFDWLSEWRWLTSYCHFMTDDWNYAFRSTARGVYAMARHITGVPMGDPRVVHHINEVRLDNRRSNLLVCANATAHLMIPHARRPVRRRATQRPHFPYSVPWSRELFEERAA